MNAEESEPLRGRSTAPAKEAGLKRPAPPEPPKPTRSAAKSAAAASDEAGATSAADAAEAMPDLDQFNFMKW